MSNPPTKAELDKINQQIKELHQQKAPQPQLRPGGSMSQQANIVDKQVLQKNLMEKQERARSIDQELAKVKGKARRDFEQ